MKKLVLIVIVLMVSNITFAQYNSSRYRSGKRPLTFQVAPSVFSYDNTAVFGFHIGLNYKEALNLSYFSMRDYNFSDGIKDYGWYGLNAAYMLNLSDNIGIGPVVRLANINGDWEKPYFGAEIRYDLSWNTKLGFEYGRSNNETGASQGFGFKLIWNIY